MFSSGIKAAFSKATIAGLIALCLCIGLTGCIYVRLLTLKGQLGRFDDYFEVVEDRDVVLVFKKPVLYSDDVVRLMESPPSYRAEYGRILSLTYVLEKMYLKGNTEEGNFDVFIGFVCTRNKLVQVLLDRKIFAFFPKEMFVDALKAFGGGEIDQQRRTLTTRLETLEKQPRLLLIDEVESLLGLPYMIRGNEYWYKYVYKQPPDYDGENIYSNLYITFDGDSGEMIKFRTILFDAKLEMSLREQEPPELEKQPVIEEFDLDGE